MGCCLWGRTESDTTEVTQQQQQSVLIHGNVLAFFHLCAQSSGSLEDTVSLSYRKVLYSQLFVASFHKLLRCGPKVWKLVPSCHFRTCTYIVTTTPSSLSPRHYSVEWKLICVLGFSGGSNSKESACNAGDLGSTPGLGRSLGKGNGNLLQYSCPKNSVNRRAWRATVHRDSPQAKSWTWLSN